jgi:ribonuclease P protein component
MLPKKFRLTVPQFYRSSKSAGRFISASFTLFTKSADQQNCRFTFLVPKSLDKRSTKRNYTKRILADIVLQNKTALIKSTDVLVKLKCIIDEKNKDRIMKEFANSLKKCGLYSN